jgi:hypothetical protein
MLKYLFYVRKIDSTHNVTCVNYLVRDLKHEENMKVLYRDNVWDCGFKVFKMYKNIFFIFLNLFLILAYENDLNLKKKSSFFF